MVEIDVSLVTFAPDLALLSRLLESLVAQPSAPRCRLFVHDNTTDLESAQGVEEIVRAAARGFASVSFVRSPRNVGFGRGHNANAARGDAPWLLVINPDCVLEPGAWDALREAVERAADDVAAFELRQVPYEHPKAYDPATLETSWVSGAATLFRRSHFDAVGGFDARIFLYGEDVDLSWRLRASGARLLYEPRAAVQHFTYAHAHEVKPVQVIRGVETNLCLRARYGGLREAARGLMLVAREIAGPSPFRGRRRGLALAALRFLAAWPHFAATRASGAPGFAPAFHGFDYAVHREGAFHPLRSRRGRSGAAPLVSILIRTCGRPAWLREALASCAAQTHRPLEVVVVEGGGGSSRDIVEGFAERMDVRYHATGCDTGRAANGNIALGLARGEWLNFLDDDDVLFADHVEVLLDAAQAARVPAAYGLAWEARTRILDRSRARYEEVELTTRHRQAFDRMTLWHHNYLPIQSVLFHRRLYERHGGFDEGMDQLEDWNLWTRYSLEDDFVMVPKTTSKYRVPHDAHEAARRQAQLDAAYRDAITRQQGMRAALSPAEVITMAETYARRHRLLARWGSRIPVARRVLRHMDVIR
ncbi:MAG TPA: glycosyltransferase family 2 protein [Usitatibacter sp.]|jgi:GT2 family glycosyltransferase|nr:glycosyltransferase family 2 protein [Usitatibacter sp.]